ncbi:uncharacterized protein LOC127579869 isoform X2 [Pristis pectinata]|uniref:uncharacterized protein LOC127579869 isoform X2 n=1 Tax=Pristis pectinata TaxID=685728 RepID=UPI00223D07CD|nr:uncharacterized protein LOC127579869 isoform X2 [Pristis pectinata]
MELDSEEKEKQRQHELQMKRRSLESDSDDGFSASREVRLVPPFEEDQVDQYFQHFEKVAVSSNWPRKGWALMVQSVIKGKAQKAYSALPAEDAADYTKVKQVILKAYELVPEAYRQKFRDLRKSADQTYMEFANGKRICFERWCLAKNVDGDYDKLTELILVEDFKRCVPAELTTYLNEKAVETLQETARLADDYALTHKSKWGQPKTFQKSYKDNPGKPESKLGGNQKGKDEKKPGLEKPVERTCYYCRKPGHVISNCALLKKKKEAGPNACFQAIKNQKGLGDAVKDQSLQEGKAEKLEEVRKEFRSYVSEGFVSLNDESPQVPVKILRDTGASQSLLLDSVLNFGEESDTGEVNLVRGVTGETMSVPFHRVILKSKFVEGPVEIGIRPSLPVEGVSLLLGNDLADGESDPVVQLTTKPRIDESENDPDVYPSCTVTRARAKELAKTDSLMQSDVVPCDSPKQEENYDALSETFLSSLEDQHPYSEPEFKDLSLSRKDFMVEQTKDPELTELKEKALSCEEIEKVPTEYYVKNGVLMRKWRPPHIPVNEEWEVIHQVVVPKVYRDEILNLAHSMPLGGHFGVNKTVGKILKQFYWPGLRKDVVMFCRTCHTCQMVGKPNQKPPVAPLKPIPAFGEPFSKVIVDCVGPLPKSKTGNQYLLTIMCATSRFPEAIPLRNIKAKTVSKALVKFFTLFGLPKEIQSDQGSNFMSKIFQQIVYELGAKQIVSSAYHPESQGALERFHSTLKNMLKTYCFENTKDWDEGIHLLLFAVRESIQESIGFSPFELVFGHRVRGPLELLREQWVNEEVHLSLLDYVQKFKTRLERVCQLARENLKTSQIRMKTYFDRRARPRTFAVGQKVLVFFPSQNNPLQARFSGPYVIESRVTDLTYIIKTPDRRKKTQLCHVNMLKPYYERDSVVALVDGVKVVSRMPDVDVEEGQFRPNIVPSKLKNQNILENLETKLDHLQVSQKQQMRELILKFKNLFPDVPNRTSIITHDVDVGDAKPIKQHPYRMNVEKSKLVDQEIKYMLENDIIRHSTSNWSSPCVIVPKPDGTVRFCTDYRKVNAVTKSDAYPIPRVDDCIDRVGKAKFLRKIDLLKGYWCVPLTDRGREISAFVTPSGLYEYNVLPFGMKNAPATFQRMINSVIHGLKHTDAYIDDLVTGNDTWEDHISALERLFERLSKANLTVNLAKSEFGHATVTYLGYVVGQGKQAPVQAKVQAISEFPIPTGTRTVRRFLGMVGYYRKFCKNFADIALPLTNLQKKGVKFVWTDSCQEAFEKLKAILCYDPVLRTPDFEKPFSLAVDASDEAAGAVLLQKGDLDDIDHPVAYFSKKFNEHQKNYSTIEKELLSLVLALQHFSVYVCTAQKPLTVYTDHNPLVFLSRVKNKNRRLLNWSLILQEFDLMITHIKGKDNVIADCLSRC